MVFEGYQPGYGFYNAFGALSRPLLKRGSTGPAVVEAQKALMNVLQRSFRFGADGQFGDETERAVREVQSRFNLAVNGTVDADTWTLLVGEDVTIGGGTSTPPSSPPTFTPPSPPPPPVDITIRERDSKQDSTMLYAGLGLVAVVGLLLMRKSKGRK